MRVRRKTGMLRDTGCESLSLAVELFNRPSRVARAQAVLIMTAHAFEMLLKAVIYQDRGRLSDKGSDQNYSFARCINIANSELGAITVDDRTLLLALKQDRDQAAHDVVHMGEDMFYLHVRSAVTIFVRTLRDVFGGDLADALPGRVIPVSAQPPTDVSLVTGKEVEHIHSLVAPGRRRTAEAEAMLRPLLALDGAVSGREDPPTSSEIRKGLTAIRGGKDWRSVLPGLASLEVAPPGEGRPAIEISLRISKDPKGLPTRLVIGDEADQALAYREINPFDKYPIRPKQFGPMIELNEVQGYAIAEALGLQESTEYFWIKRAPKGYVLYQGYSPKAVDRARAAIANGEVDVAGALISYMQKRQRSDRRRNASP